MNIIETNFGEDEITWHTETYPRRREAYKAAFSGARAFGKANRWDGQFMDHTGKGEPVLKMVKRVGKKYEIITRK